MSNEPHLSGALYKFDDIAQWWLVETLRVDFMRSTEELRISSQPLLCAHHYECSGCSALTARQYSIFEKIVSSTRTHTWSDFLYVCVFCWYQNISLGPEVSSYSRAAWICVYSIVLYRRSASEPRDCGWAKLLFGRMFFFFLCARMFRGQHNILRPWECIVNKKMGETAMPIVDCYSRMCSVCAELRNRLRDLNEFCFCSLYNGNTRELSIMSTTTSANARNHPGNIENIIANFVVFRINATCRRRCRCQRLG